MTFAPLASIDYAPTLPLDSTARAHRVLDGYVLVRPYSPRGSHHGIWLERNPTHPRVWGWLLAVPQSIRDVLPGARPGALVVYRRHHGEILDHDEPREPRFLGHRLDVLALPVEAIQAIIEPALRPLEV